MPDVGVLHFAAQRGGQQEKPEHGGGGDQDHAGQADPVIATGERCGDSQPPSGRFGWLGVMVVISLLELSRAASLPERFGCAAGIALLHTSLSEMQY